MVKKLILLFSALLILAWVTTISSLINTPTAYEQHLEAATEYEAEQLYLAANEEYDQALLILPDDVETMIKRTSNLLYLDEISEFEVTCKSLYENYSNAEEALSMLADYYIAEEDEYALVEYLYEIKDEGYESDLIDELLSQYGGTYREIYGTYSYLSQVYNNSVVYEQDGSYGLIDTAGEHIIEGVYQGIMHVSVDSEWIYVMEEENYFVNDDENRVAIIPEGYIIEGIYSEGQVVANKDGKYGYLDENLDEVCEFQWDDLTAIADGYGAAKSGEKWALIEDDGELITDYIYDDIAISEMGFCSLNKVFLVEQNGTWIMVNQKGETVGTETFTAVQAFISDEYAAVQQDGKWGYVNDDGEIIIEAQYDEAQSFQAEMAGVLVDGLWGYIDMENRLLLTGTFEECTPVSEEGVASVKNDNWYLIKFAQFE